MDNIGFKDKYDVLHVPQRSNHCNLGYAFMRFLGSADARRFYKMISGTHIAGHTSGKRLDVVPANIQSCVGTKRRVRKALRGKTA